MIRMVKVLAIPGSLREHSLNRRVLNVAVDGARKAGADVTLIDLCDYPMPIYNADDHAKGFDPNASRLQELFNSHNVLPSEIAVTFADKKFDGNSAEMTDPKMKAILEDLGAALVEMLKKTHGDIEFVTDTSS